MIKHLVIVAGPSRSGKTYLLKDLLRNRLEAINKKLGIESFDSWQCISECKIPTLKDSDHNEIVLCYNFLHKGLRELHKKKLQIVYDNDHIAQLIQKSLKISFLTLWVSPERFLLYRFKRELRRIETSPLTSVIGIQLTITYLFLRILPDKWIESCFRRILNTKRVSKLIDSSSKSFIRDHINFYCQAKLIRFYQNWLQFSEKFKFKINKNLILVYNKNIKIYSREASEKLFNI